MTIGTEPPELDRYGCMAVLLAIASMVLVCWVLSVSLSYLIGGI